MDYQPMTGVPAESSTNEETVSSCYDPVTGSYLTAQPSNYQFPHCQHHPGVPRQHPQAVSVMGVAGQQQVYAQPSCSGSSLSQLLQILKTQNPPHSEVLALLKKNPALMAQVLKLKEQRMQQQQLQQQQQQQQQQIQQQQIQQQAVLSVQMQQHPCMGDSNAEMGMGQQHSDMVPHTPSDELVEIMERLGL